MMREIGLLLLCGGLCMLGICATQHLRRREKNLRELICGLEAVRREMKYNLAPLGDLFRLGAAQTTGNVSAIFAEVAECADNSDGVDFKTNWTSNLEKQRLYLAETDMMALQQLGTVLGRYDGDEQLRSLDATVDRLRELCHLAEERSTRLGKVYTTLGLVSGAFVFLLLV